MAKPRLRLNKIRSQSLNAPFLRTDICTQNVHVRLKKIPASCS